MTADSSWLLWYREEEFVEAGMKVDHRRIDSWLNGKKEEFKREE